VPALSAEDKHKRAEMRRKEEEDRKKSEMEAKGQKLKDRMKVHLTAAAAKSAVPAPSIKPAAPSIKPAAPSLSQAPLQPSKSVNQPSSAVAPAPPPLSAKREEQPSAAPADKTNVFSFVKQFPTTKGTPNAAIKTTMDKAQHPPLTPADLRNIQKLIASPYVSKAPASVKKALEKKLVDYEISPYR
jgi:hypothetical protein